jgi:hypothetical protein
VSASDIRKIREVLLTRARVSGIDDLFWMEIPEDLLSPIQCQHRDCRPHVFAVEVGESWVKTELFSKSLTTMRCECQRYGTERQIQYALRWIDSMLEGLRIRT